MQDFAAQYGIHAIPSPRLVRGGAVHSRQCEWCSVPVYAVFSCDNLDTPFPVVRGDPPVFSAVLWPMRLSISYE